MMAAERTHPQPTSGRPPVTLVIGLGNPILGDDGLGWQVAEAVRTWLAADGAALADTVEVDCAALGGLSLMERMVGYDRAVVIDAVTMEQPPGTVLRFELEELPDFSAHNAASAHDTSLQNALRLGRQMGAHLPTRVTVIGVQAEQLYEFSEALTPAVAAAVPVAAQRVIEVLTSP